MDCPHCQTENLIGASLCAGCGAALRARPPLAPSHPAPAAHPSHGSSASSSHSGVPELLGDDDDGYITPVSVQPPMPPAIEPQETDCRMCQQPFLWRLGDVQICPACKQRSPHSSSTGLGSPPAVGSRGKGIGERAPISRPISVKVPRRSTGVPRGVAALVIGGALVASGFAVVKFTKPKSNPGGALVQNVRNDVAKLVLAPPATEVKRFVSTLRLHTKRTDTKRGFAVTSVLTDFRQAAEEHADVSHVRSEARGHVVDVFSTCKATEQTGKIHETKDFRENIVYPFAGHSATQRIVLSADSEAVNLESSTLVAGRDFPPLLCIGNISAGTRDVSPGDHWRAEIELPATTDRAAALLVERFPAEVTYVGRSTVRGFVCAAFRIAGTAPKALPESLEKDYDRRQLKLGGAVLYEISTGLLVEATLDVEHKFTHSSGETGDELTVTGKIEARRQ